MNPLLYFWLFLKASLFSTGGFGNLPSLHHDLLARGWATESQFAESMNLMAREIGRVFGELDLTKTQAQWENALNQAGTMEERMDLFLDSMEQGAIAGAAPTTKQELVTDEEIDRMIQADVLAQEKQELGKLDELESEIARELGDVT